ncbi:uncharacterized protein F4807DRAFT_146950 [Annulohypoxylon truncatum]|uniref:uncharacterized protein n=1 Tax=Annulohypoxylon truncatum TaxID=327061 RepID=UPI002007CD95|nr:uncharacterized protein F4807DRAFT_146950 [Annulohypoxylon truncatum]KAI1208695.1 hypothetical protein F4807DRAFT_146950 [Annulohypoxylon truncatum]
MADHLALTTSASSDSTMEGHSRPAKIATLSFAHTPNLATLEQMNMNLPFPTGRNPTDAYKPGRIGNRLALWYHRNDGPWTPPGLTSPQGDLRNPAILNSLRANPLVFSSHYRESIVSSECDTIAPGAVPSDSGYGGSYGAKHSVANGSVCDESPDRNQETQSLVGHIGDLNFQSYGRDMIPKGGVNPETSWSQSHQSPSPSSVINRHLNFEGETCEICHKVLKTKSEFKKHKQRHDKPFKCNVKYCTRSVGFSTPNDLDRHIRSLHPEEDATGNRYRCPIGACKNKDKIWPRADNFRAHMRRVHQENIKDNDLDQYLFRPTTSSKDSSDIARDSAAPASDRFMFPVGSENLTLPRHPVIDLSTETSPMEGPSQVQMEETPLMNESSDEGRSHSSITTPAQRVHSERDDASLDEPTEIPRTHPVQSYPTFNDDTEFAKLDQVNDSGSSLDSRETDSNLASNSSSLDHDKADELEESQGSPSGPSFESTRSNRQVEDLADIDNDSNAHRKPRGLDEMTGLDITDHDVLLKFLEKLRSSGVLEQLGYKKDEPLEQEVPNQEPVRNTASDQAYVCPEPECRKSFGRRCELKKHEKRHLKPYGCTFPDCKKKFGSKNDWKRHENSQHYMLEHWRCDEKQTGDSAGTCGKVLPRRELFTQHLVTCHRIKDSTILESKVERCRVGRNSEVRFWCGFCQEIVEVKKDGIEAWTERFNHIDDHFNGRNNQEKKEIGDWQNEYSPNNTVESPADDSEDCSATSSTPATSANSSDTSGHTRLEKRQARTTKQKRKRDDGCDESAKRHAVEEIARYHCVCDPYCPYGHASNAVLVPV